jgi:hypothetical protein
MSIQVIDPRRVFCLALSVAALAGCKSNIDHIYKSAPNAAPPVMVYNVSQDRVWAAAQAALSGGPAFKTLDRQAAVMITEYRNVDSKELSLIGTIFLGKTYKTNYTLNLRALAPDRTELAVNVGVQVQQVGILVREDDDPQVKSFMRQKLFDQIGVILKP